MEKVQLEDTSSDRTSCYELASKETPFGRGDVHGANTSTTMVSKQFEFAVIRSGFGAFRSLRF